MVLKGPSASLWQILLHCGGDGRGSNMICSSSSSSSALPVVISSSAFATVEVFCFAYSALAAWTAGSALVFSSTQASWSASSTLVSSSALATVRWGGSSVCCEMHTTCFLNQYFYHCQTAIISKVNEVTWRVAKYGDPYSESVLCI